MSGDLTKVKLKTRRCPYCENTAMLEVDVVELERYLGGVAAQSAFPTMSSDDHERLISGICPGCWDTVFGEEAE